MSKKERKAKKEEARRAKLQQERDSAVAVRLLENELYEYQQLKQQRKRRKSAEHKVFALEEVKIEQKKKGERVKKGVTYKKQKTMSSLIHTGKFSEII